jgi:hypothetical protein
MRVASCPANATRKAESQQPTRILFYDACSRQRAAPRIVGLDAIMAEAVATKFMSAPLAKEQIAELVRMQTPPK